MQAGTHSPLVVALSLAVAATLVAACTDPVRPDGPDERRGSPPQLKYEEVPGIEAGTPHGDVFVMDIPPGGSVTFTDYDAILALDDPTDSLVIDLVGGVYIEGQLVLPMSEFLRGNSPRIRWIEPATQYVKEARLSFAITARLWDFSDSTITDRTEVPTVLSSNRDSLRMLYTRDTMPMEVGLYWRGFWLPTTICRLNTTTCNYGGLYPSSSVGPSAHAVVRMYTPRARPLTCTPSTPVRGLQVTTCRAAVAGTIEGWSFHPDSGYPGLPVVERPPDATEPTWSGRIVASGRVEVRYRDTTGALLRASAHIDVQPRGSSDFAPIQFPGGGVRIDSTFLSQFEPGVLKQNSPFFAVGYTPNPYLNLPPDARSLIAPVEEGGPNAGYAMLARAPDLNPAKIWILGALYGDATSPFFQDQNGRDEAGRTIDPKTEFRYCTQQDLVNTVRPAVEAHEGASVAPSASSHVGRWVQVFATKDPAGRFERLVVRSSASTEEVKSHLNDIWREFVTENADYVNTQLDATYNDTILAETYGCALDFNQLVEEP
jgi:hypothetical protein